MLAIVKNKITSWTDLSCNQHPVHLIELVPIDIQSTQYKKIGIHYLKTFKGIFSTLETLKANNFTNEIELDIKFFEIKYSVNFSMGNMRAIRTLYVNTEFSM